ncbi:hypothetical protein MLD63_04610 [Paracoccus sp. TK19116]|uniref:O-antigen ligase domain-containing protein n=1 Tax=Paracoccus albicereus TaxID=2922394 RepID=A0ABT1MQU7_9RHOB|nr:hypothetical protein [Paracoccus albicereus]MCQ0969708.1 hypothetical protein [Paracoccus albicereus]
MAIVLFRRLPLPVALVWSILAPYLILPEGLSVDFPVLPGFDKHSIPSLCALVLVLAAGRRGIKGRGDRRLAEAQNESGHPDGKRQVRRGRSRPSVFFTFLTALAIAAPIPTNLLNGDFLLIGGRFIQGTGFKDMYGVVILTALSVVPFLLARRHLGRAEDQVMLMKALVAACLVYSLLMLFEVRMSPQLHRILYGYHAHSFAQHVRGGHYRPMVFLEHGLRVGIFVAMAALSCATMWRIAQKARAKGHGTRSAGTERGADTVQSRPSRVRRHETQTSERPPSYWALRLTWLTAVLVLSRNLGATMILVLLLPAVLLLGVRLQIMIAAVFAALILIYPMARGSGIVPTDRILSFAASIDEDRGRSLEFRLMNEDMLLARANEKPLFGWSGWGRSRVYDPETGDDISTTDGSWVILIGTSGWVGYLATFGLLTAPVLMMFRRRKVADQAAAGLTLILTANLLDLVPNSSLTPITWLIAGSLAGRVEQMANKPTETGRRRNTQPSVSRSQAPETPPSPAFARNSARRV